METVDFMVQQKGPAKDHAGWASLVFKDVREKDREAVKTVAVVRSRAEDLTHPDVEYGMSMLSHMAEQVVNWSDVSARTEFLEQRRQVALGMAA